jgi:NAD(P)-dependent dehydrogenase (short-subunit alcohol dehydrogenase family)
MELQLRGHVAVVTGGASGIGRAIAEGFAAEGAHVACWDRAPQTPDVAREIGDQTGVRTWGICLDVADERAVVQAAEETAARLGPLDHLVHSAAVGSGKFGFPFTNLQPADWRRTLEINILGMVHVAHALAPALTARKTGTMVFISSVAGQIGSQTDPPYSASKAGLINFMQCASKDLARFGVRVNALCPGMVRTALNRSVFEAWAAREPQGSRPTYEEWAAEKIAKLVPLGRWQEPEDIAAMAVFLASPRAANVTGQTINVDGGYVMHW